MATNKGWRQCGQCQHMIERTYGCNYMRCRCGYAFCYKCGEKWSWSHVCRTRTGRFFRIMVGLTVLVWSAHLFIDYSGKAQIVKRPTSPKSEGPKSKGTQDFPDFLFGFL